MKLSGDDYIGGAGERLEAASQMYKSSRFVDALYLAGVAVECVLRAYAQDESDEFEGRHDLSRLMKAATVERFAGEKQRQAISAALGEVWTRWKNNYRYAPDSKLRAELKRLQLDRGIKGDALKENARVALQNASTIVNKGSFIWKNK
jgi:HEPN domain-containing protein